MRLLLALLLGFLGVQPVWADKPLRLTSPGCGCGPVCDCDRDCGCLSYAEAYARGLKENKPLAVFVNVKTATVPGCLIVKVTSFPGVSAPGVVLCVPDGRGGFDRIADCHGPCSAERLRVILDHHHPAGPPDLVRTPWLQWQIRPGTGVSFSLGRGVRSNCAGGHCR